MPATCGGGVVLASSVTLRPWSYRELTLCLLKLWFYLRGEVSSGTLQKDEFLELTSDPQVYTPWIGT